MVRCTYGGSIQISPLITTSWKRFSVLFFSFCHDRYFSELLPIGAEVEPEQYGSDLDSYYHRNAITPSGAHLVKLLCSFLVDLPRMCHGIESWNGKIPRLAVDVVKKWQNTCDIFKIVSLCLSLLLIVSVKIRECRLGVVVYWPI